MSEPLVFPQLRSGAVSSYPVQKKLRFRTVLNVTPGKEQIRYFDPGFQECEWVLSYESLEDDELNTLANFFDRCQGQLRSFTFCEPDANLLQWSERLTDAPWQADPLLVVDFCGNATFRLKNTSQTWAGLSQVASVPRDYELCFALQTHSRSRTSVRLSVESGRVSTYDAVSTNDWQDTWVAHQSDDIAARCRIEIPAGAELEVRMPRLSPQRFPGSYRRTDTNSGLSHSARFASDSIRVATTRAGSHNLLLRVVASTIL